MTATTIPQLAACLRDVLSTCADRLGRSSGFVQRESKLTGAKFVQALVLGWLGHPTATRAQLAQCAARVGVTISASGLYQRMTRAGAECLRQVLELAMQRAIAGEPLAIPILRRFRGVELQDSTIISLPDALADAWVGGSGPAAVKVQTRWDYLGGCLRLELRPGREHDQRAPDHDETLPAGALHIADLGYFDLRRLAQLAQRGVYWLLRLRLQTRLYSDPAYPSDAACCAAPTAPDGGQDVLALLQRCDAQTRQPAGLELRVLLGAEQRLPARLLARRVPSAEAEQRRQRLRYIAQRKCQPVSAHQLALADWWILVTNVPTELLSLREAFVLYRVRWQIELLFKLWKDAGKLDEWRSANPDAILCEVYAKLLALLIQHWVVIVCGGISADRSLVLAAQAVRAEAAHLAGVLTDPFFCQRALEALQRSLTVCRMSKRKKAPHTWQHLLALEPLRVEVA